MANNIIDDEDDSTISWNDDDFDSAYGEGREKANNNNEDKKAIISTTPIKVVSATAINIDTDMEKEQQKGIQTTTARTIKSPE